MHHFFFLLLSTSTITYGLSVPLINKRTDPTLMSGNGLTRTHTVTLTRRTNPTFEDGDFGDDWDGVSKKDVLESAFDDVYTLALSAVNQFDDRIFNNWFPPKDRDSVKAVFSAIVKNENEDPNLFKDLTVGADILANFEITPLDFLHGDPDNDFCDQGADAYTQNHGADTEHNNEPWARTHFCDAAFGDKENEQPPTLNDIKCSDLGFIGADGTQRFRITNEMESIGATVLHEIIHFNGVARASDLPDVGPNQAIIDDIGGDDDTTPIEAIGSPYFSWMLRNQVNTPKADVCAINADNYVWFALEIYWTNVCAEQLNEHQDGAFDPPKEP